MSRSTTPRSELIETARDHTEEIEAAASKRDAPAGLVILDALAHGESPPDWAIEDLEERL